MCLLRRERADILALVKNSVVVFCIVLQNLLLHPYIEFNALRAQSLINLPALKVMAAVIIIKV